MTRHRIILWFITIFLISSPLFAGEKTTWNGYIQTRFHTDFDQQSSFQIRRGKLWLKGTLPHLGHLRYKFQVVYRSFKDKSFLVQDAYAEYRQDALRLRVGRFVPDFTLEWNQPDAIIPLMERNSVVKALMHGETSTARQIGMQASYLANSISGSIGVFNAEQEVPGENAHSDLLYTSRVSGQLTIRPGWQLQVGGSFAYRYLHESVFSKIANPSTVFSGNDYRYGLEGKLSSSRLDLQAEWLQADIAGQSAKGAYLLLNMRPAEKWELVPFVDWFKDLRAETGDHPWYGAAVSYHFQKQNKIMLEYKWQAENGRLNHYAALQLQIFINS